MLSAYILQLTTNREMDSDSSYVYKTNNGGNKTPPCGSPLRAEIFFRIMSSCTHYIVLENGIHKLALELLFNLIIMRAYPERWKHFIMLQILRCGENSKKVSSQSFTEAWRYIRLLAWIFYGYVDRNVIIKSLSECAAVFDTGGRLDVIYINSHNVLVKSLTTLWFTDWALWSLSLG